MNVIFLYVTHVTIMQCCQTCQTARFLCFGNFGMSVDQWAVWAVTIQWRKHSNDSINKIIFSVYILRFWKFYTTLWSSRWRELKNCSSTLLKTPDQTSATNFDFLPSSARLYSHFGGSYLIGEPKCCKSMNSIYVFHEQVASWSIISNSS